MGPDTNTLDSQAAKNRLRVVQAIVGGGLQLKPGQVVEEQELGRHLDQFVELGAVERLEEHP